MRIIITNTTYNRLFSEFPRENPLPYFRQTKKKLRYSLFVAVHFLCLLTLNILLFALTHATIRIGVFISFYGIRNISLSSHLLERKNKRKNGHR